MTKSPSFHQPLKATAIILSLFLLLFSAPCISKELIYDEEISLQQAVEEFQKNKNGKSGAYIFEKGEEALLSRAWLTDKATQKIDVQYFIWSTDNIGILAAEALLRAADRGVKVRVIVDDLLIDAPDDSMLALNEHPNIDIKIYNPKHSVGVSLPKRLKNILLQFHSSNQRMHDKTFSVDGLVAITGGRNMADEYFDFNKKYNFRDRDILLVGPVIKNIENNFDAFYNSDFVVSVDSLLNSPEKPQSVINPQSVYDELHNYASNEENFEKLIRHNIQNIPQKLPLLKEAMTWGEIFFSHDIPGKNKTGTLSGGSKTYDRLIKEISSAKKRVVIQSPYLVVPEGGIELFKQLTDRGVSISISTNSLASTDNLQAFSGYAKQRKAILDAGVEVYEFKPNPEVQRELIERYERLEKTVPTFAIHAKTMVIDRERVFVGTFNLDPRSAHLNTEVGVHITDATLAQKVEAAILTDMRPENSWNSRKDEPNQYAPTMKKLKMHFWKLFPLTPIL